MKKTVIYLFLILAIPVNVYSLRAQDNDLFRQGVMQYSSGDYRQAKDLWKQIYDEGTVTSELCYNLGNACYKLNDISGAIIWYERARRIDPLDENILHNLGLARERITDRFNEIPELFFNRWFTTLALLLSANTWAVLSIIIFALSVAGWLIFLLTRRYLVGRAALTTALVALAFATFSLGMSFKNRSLFRSQSAGVIISPAVTGMSSPGAGANELFVIHEGTMVEIKERVNDWLEIRLPDGNLGWIPQNSIEIV